MVGGSPPPPPSSQQVSQTSEFPDELKPYISDILERAKTRAESRTEAGYQEYPAPRQAGFTEEQTQAQQGIVDMANQGIAGTPLGQSKTYLAPALGATYSSAQQWTPQAAQSYMSPYIQSVVDIQKREAERQGDQQMQNIGASATQGAGAFGGSRQAILEAEQMRNEGQLMNDIQARGMQSAYETGLGAFERQRGRDLAAGQQFAGLGLQAPQQAIQELSGLASVGAQKQQQQQGALDIGYQTFLEEQQQPERVLQEYSSIVRGFPLTPNQFGVTQSSTPAPNALSQIAGAVGTGAGLYGAFKKKAGGAVGDGKGLATIYRAESGQISGPQTNPNLRRAEVQEELAMARKMISDSIDTRRELSRSQKEELKRDKFLELAKMGANMMALGGQGKGLLEAVGTAGAPAIDGLRDIRGQERQLESAAATAEMDAVLQGLGLSMKEISMMDNAEKLRIIEEGNQMDAAAKMVAAQAAAAKANKQTGTGVATGDQTKTLNNIKNSFVGRITADAGKYLPVMSSLNGAIQTEDDLKDAVTAIPEDVLNAEVLRLIKNEDLDANRAMATAIQNLLPSVKKKDGGWFSSDWKY